LFHYLENRKACRNKHIRYEMRGACSSVVSFKTFFCSDKYGVTLEMRIETHIDLHASSLASEWSWLDNSDNRTRQ
jgi:hypothetical protein